MRIPELIKKKRYELRLSQKDLATQLGYSCGQFISNWERGVSTPPLDITRSLCKILKIEIGSYKSRLLDDFKEKINNEL